MLPRPLRLTSPTDHRAVVRRGRRAGGGALTVHLLLDAVERRPDPPGPSPVPAVPRPVPARAGLVVGKVVGNAVVRHRVARRLRHLLAPRLAALPAGARLVVRAGAPAAEVDADLARDLDAALSRLSRAGVPRGGRR